MTLQKFSALIAAVGLSLVATNLRAQDASGSVDANVVVDTKVQPDPVVTGTVETTTDTTTNTTADTGDGNAEADDSGKPPGDKPAPQKPATTLGSQLSAEVKAMVEKRREERKTYLSAKQEIIVQMRKASADKRAELRDQLRGKREAWVDARMKLLQETKVRMGEIRAEFKNQADVQGVIDAAKERASHRRGQD